MLSAVAGVHADPGVRARSSSSVAYADGFAPEPQHLIVTRALTLAREAGRGVPDQRIEPVDRARQLRDRLRAPIAPLDMRQLVHERRLPCFHRPRDRRRRHHHDRCEKPGDVRARLAQRLSNVDRSLEPIRCADHPRFGEPGFRRRRDPLQTDKPLRNQQNTNHTRTASTVPRVPMVPRVPRACSCWVPTVPGSTHRLVRHSEPRSER